MERQVAKFAVFLVCASAVSACDMGAIGDPEENEGRPMHEVYLEDADGERATLGYYDAQSQVFYESSTIDSPHDSLFVEVGEDSYLKLFPHVGIDNQGAVLDVEGGYSVFTYGDQSSEDSADWEIVDVGVAYVDPVAFPQSLDIASITGHKWNDQIGEAKNDCEQINRRVNGRVKRYRCNFHVWDNKATDDKKCVGQFLGWSIRTGKLTQLRAVSCNSGGNSSGWRYWNATTVVPRHSYVTTIKDVDPEPGIDNRTWVQEGLDVRKVWQRNRYFDLSTGCTLGACAF